MAKDAQSIALIEKTFAAKKPLALVCHAPGVLCHAKAPGGEPLVKGRKVTGFTNSEEEGVQLTQVVPFLVGHAQGEWRAVREGRGLGAVCADRWDAGDGAGPASSEPAAKAVLGLLK